MCACCVMSLPVCMGVFVARCFRRTSAACRIDGRGDAGYYEIGMSRWWVRGTQYLGIWINTILNSPEKKIRRDYRSHPDAITFQYFILLLKHTRAGMRPLLNYLGNVGCQLQGAFELSRVNPFCSKNIRTKHLESW